MEIKSDRDQQVAASSLPGVGELAGAVSGSRDSSLRQELLCSLSAMMDDEAETLEIRRVVSSLKSEPQLQNYWHRYHAVRNVIQSSSLPLATTNLLPGIQARLAQDADISGNLSKNKRFLRSAAGIVGQGLVAATVAVAILVAYPSLQNSGGSTDISMLAQQDSSEATQTMRTLPQMSGDYSPSALTRTVSLDEAAMKRLEKAVRNFSGTSAVLDSDRLPMFVNQLEPFAPVPPALDSSQPKP